MPASLKVLITKVVNDLARKIGTLEKRYGLDGTNTKAIPDRQPSDYKRDFNEITKRLIANDYKTQEEFENLKSQRLNLASKFS
jgi:hypothetical protein